MARTLCCEACYGGSEAVGDLEIAMVYPVASRTTDLAARKESYTLCCGGRASRSAVGGELHAPLWGELHALLWGATRSAVGGEPHALLWGKSFTLC